MDLTGVRFVITGTLSELRGKYERLIVAAGGRVGENVSRFTDYVVVGEAPGGRKLRGADEYGTKLIGESDLRKLLELDEAISLRKMSDKVPASLREKIATILGK